MPLLSQISSANKATHIDSDPRELEDGDLLVLVAGDEAEELVAVLEPRSY